MLPRNKEPPNAIHPLFVAGDYVSAVADGLPALPDHHANPGPGLAAVLHAVLPHRPGKRPPGRAVPPRRSVNDRPLSRHAEGPSGDPATPELHRVQRAPADGPARLPRAAQGTARVPAGGFFCSMGLFCSEHQCHTEE